MASNNFSDNVYTHTFTPREYQVELLDTTKRKNTIVCSSTSSAKAFIALKLVQEFSWQMRSQNGKRAIFILNSQNVPVMTTQIKLLTDLNVISVSNSLLDCEQWKTILMMNSVIIMTVDICVELLLAGYLDISLMNLIVVDDCLYGERQLLLKQLIDKYRQLQETPRVLGLVSGLLGADLKPILLEAEMQRLEKLLYSVLDTSSELVSTIRLSCRPQEHIIECDSMVPGSIQIKLKQIVLNAKEFLLDHRFDPSEIYADEFLEELKHVPDPKIQPIQLLDDVLIILEELGPWAADQAALTTLCLIDKLKVKIPYERHYLLLCMISTVMVTIRSYCDYEFGEMTDKERVLAYSSPKIIKFLNILKQFKPDCERPQIEAIEAHVEAAASAQQTKGRRTTRGARRSHILHSQNEDNLCGLVFVQNRCTAKVLCTLLYTMSQCDDDYWWLSPLYTVDKIVDPIKEPKEAEAEHHRQEEVLRKYRAHECNIMIATSVLEQGCDLPKCNLVVRFDLPRSFHSYVQSKSKARVADSYYIILVTQDQLQLFVEQLAEYIEVESTLLRRCSSLEPCETEKEGADEYSAKISPYRPLPALDAPAVSLATAISLVNRYCAKLPSDTFTRLTPLWEMDHIEEGYICSLRLPINSPVKQKISSKPMCNQLLAKRVCAFFTCQLLHMAGELDDNLQPVGKENFKANEEDWNYFQLEPDDEELTKENVEQRPGTTKRRQYYYKRVSDGLLNCNPALDIPVFLYHIVMTLTCPLPEEQNTRGRKIYPPEESLQGFGILTTKEIPPICPFPIFTRSGEVCVSIKLCSDNIQLSLDKIHKISEFINYTFTSVLRLQKYLMLFNPQESESSYFIVPTCTYGMSTDIDWKFLDLIYENRDVLPETIPDDKRSTYDFDPNQYKDAVVMPWYRNQDQPQYFYVAEICTNLNPKSAFPGSEYATFEEYYLRKYNIQIQNKEQHLLDVDHTSARLNFLTPRYINRKGVALPTSSEETKRAKRENLEQKQILVPELCAIHPFPASLWRKAVCLPCILYRINSLLLADQIRRTVARDIGLGTTNLPKDFKWPSLNFGWNLADILKKSKCENEPKVAAISDTQAEVKSIFADSAIGSDTGGSKSSEVEKKESDNDSEKDSDIEVEAKEWVEIGTWSNDMFATTGVNGQSAVRYASPTSWMHNTYDDFSDSDESFSAEDTDSENGGLHIEFTGDNIAEAIETEPDRDDSEYLLTLHPAWDNNNAGEHSEQCEEDFGIACVKNAKYILDSGVLIRKGDTFLKLKERERISNLAVPFDNTKAELLYPVKFRRPSALENLNVKLVVVTDPNEFSFDRQPDIQNHPGPSPSIILQALTMSNANDGINLERLETIGDSFLKYAITDYLYTKYENIHEGKLSHLRSKQVSNLNLYRLGKKKLLGESMIATKFDPHDNWLPPCYYVPKELEEALIDARVPYYWSLKDMAALRNMSVEQICDMVREKGEALDIPSIIPYNLITQHSIPDKSIADCVEALIGAYLIECGPRGALLFMAWLGVRVLPQGQDGVFTELQYPHTPLIRNVQDPEGELATFLDGYDKFEDAIGYRFRDKSYLLQALTHASYSPNALTDCYQRLEFLGDAVLDYLITRHLYEDSRMHSPGALTDLRSALVNNTIFASLAVRNNFHKYFKHLSPGLHEVVERFIRLQEESGYALVDELYLLAEYECEEVEDVEVPKALGDVFESVAGAIFLDSGRSLDAVWKVYYQMMKKEIEQFSDRVPKSPIRELLELEPETAKFGTPEKLADGRRVRVSVEIFGKGVFKGIGRNYRIAKCTAAKCALKHLKKQGLVKKNFN